MQIALSRIWTLVTNSISCNAKHVCCQVISLILLEATQFTDSCDKCLCSGQKILLKNMYKQADFIIYHMETHYSWELYLAVIPFHISKK